MDFISVTKSRSIKHAQQHIFSGELFSILQYCSTRPRCSFYLFYNKSDTAVWLFMIEWWGIQNLKHGDAGGL